MRNLKRFCKSVVTAVYLATAAGAALAQDTTDLDQLMAELADPSTQNWEQVERRIRLEWSKSGSPAMDLLLQRGEEAMMHEDWQLALEHFTALTDHAPDFAEGWNARATVYFQLGLYGPALDDIGHTLALNPKHFSALSGLAIILEELDKGPDALEVWQMLAEIHPHRPETQDALQRLGQAYGGVPL